MRSPSPRRLAAAVALAALLSGCGKSLPAASSNPRETLTTRGASVLVTQNTTRLGGADPASDAAAVALAVHPGLTRASRASAVVLVDEHDWPTALAASALASSPLHAPVLYAEGSTLPAVSAQALAAMRPTGTHLLGGAQVLQIGVSAAPASYSSTSLIARDPFSSAVQIERLLGVIDGHRPHEVIVVAADGPPALAMPAAGLAAQTGAPILFVTAAGVPAATAAALSRLHHPAIYVVGPSAGVSEAVLGELARFGHTTRIVSPQPAFSGADPASNAIAVALFNEGSFGWGVSEPGHGLVFANASRPLDAPAAALLSASGDYGPLLLLETGDRVPPKLAEYLSDIQPAYGDTAASGPVHGVYNHGWLIGGEQAISATVQAELDTMLEIAPQASSHQGAAAVPQTPGSEPQTPGSEPPASTTQAPAGESPPSGTVTSG